MRTIKPPLATSAVIALAALAAVLAIFWRAKDTSRNEPGTSESRKDSFFMEAAAESGITFRMSFLPEEQGEKFKVNLYDHGSGVAIADYDGDGYDDIYLVNQLGPNALYRNRGDGTFEDKTQEAGVALGDRICAAATFADYDNDGRQDLFVTSIRGGNVLFHNEGSGLFRDVTKEAGLHLVGHCQSGHFFDFDGDGYLDLLVTRTAKWTTSAREPKFKYFSGKDSYFDTIGSEKEFNVLYRNNRDGTFTDVTEAVGLKGLGWSADAAVLDYDGDGYLDVVITNMFGRAQLYRNQGNGTFVDVTKDVLGKTSWGGMGVVPFDFNNDGKLDLYMVDMHSDMWLPYDADLSVIPEKRRFPFAGGANINAEKDEQAFADLARIRYDEVVFGNTFFKNLGQGRFIEISERANLETFWPWGIGVGDYDNDGYEDVFIPSGMGHPFDYWPNYLMMNEGNETFTKRARDYGIEPPRKGIYLEKKIGRSKAVRSSRAAAVADFDKDGRLDIIVNNFNDHPYYFRNKSREGKYVAFRLTGTSWKNNKSKLRTSRDAVGAVVRLYTGQEIMTRQVNCASGYLSQSSRVLHFGLGQRDHIDKVEITWPSGRRQSIPPPALNAVHTVPEPED
jgi:hypothetical protein